MNVSEYAYIFLRIYVYIYTCVCIYMYTLSRDNCRELDLRCAYAHTYRGILVNMFTYADI